MTQEEALEKAVKACGGPAELARRFGVTVQAVSQWKVAPSLRVLAIEEATGGEVSRHDLRPDLYPQENSEAA